MVVLSTHNLLAADPPERLARLMRLGADALALGPHPGDRDALCALGGRAAWIAILVPRDPRLATADRHERDRAVSVAFAELDRANRLECPHVALDLGTIDGLAGAWRELRDAFARGKLDGDQRAAFLADRREAAGPALDAARRSLDRLLPLAERRGVALGLLPAATGEALGLSAETRALCGDYAGAPLVRWRATDCAYRLQLLGLQPAAPIAEAGALIADAAGLLGGLPPGSGEVDWAAALQGLTDDAPRVLQAERATDAELSGALGFLRSLPATGR